MRSLFICIRDRGEAWKEADASRFCEGMEWWRSVWMEKEINDTVLEQGQEEPQMNPPLDIMPKPYEPERVKEQYPVDGWPVEITAWTVIAVILIGTLIISYLVFKELSI